MPSLSGYKSELEYSYAPGIFPSMECLRYRPERVRRVLLHSLTGSAAFKDQAMEDRWKAKQAAKMAEALEEAEKENSGTGSGDIADMLKSSGSPDVSDVFKTGR